MTMGNNSKNIKNLKQIIQKTFNEIIIDNE